MASGSGNSGKVASTLVRRQKSIYILAIHTHTHANKHVCGINSLLQQLKHQPHINNNHTTKTTTTKYTKIIAATIKRQSRSGSKNNKDAAKAAAGADTGVGVDASAVAVAAAAADDDDT